MLGKKTTTRESSFNGWKIRKKKTTNNLERLVVTVSNVTVVITEFMERMSSMSQLTSPCRATYTRRVMMRRGASVIQW